MTFLILINFTIVDAKADDLSVFKKKDYFKISARLTGKALENICDKTELVPTGLGYGMLDCVYEIKLFFSLYGPQEQVELRHLIVVVVDALLDEVNHSQDLRPFLQTFPYGPENITITILIYNIDGSRTYEPVLGSVSLYNGFVEYGWRAEGKIVTDIIKTESYKKAKDIVLAERFGYTGPLCDDPAMAIEGLDRPTD